MNVLTFFNHTVLRCIIINYNDILASTTIKEVFGIEPQLNHTMVETLIRWLLTAQARHQSQAYSYGIVAHKMALEQISLSASFHYFFLLFHSSITDVIKS
jgi:hypothetical protein